MKLTAAFLMSLGVASAVKYPDPRLTRHRRQKDDNNVKIGEVCRTHDLNTWQWSCGVMTTYKYETDIWAAIGGEFNMNTGDFLVHLFDSDCNHKDTKEYEPQEPGFKATLELDEWEVDVGTSCFDKACGNGIQIGDMWIEGKWDSWEDSWYHCWDDETWTEGIGAYSYRFCEMAC